MIAPRISMLGYTVKNVIPVEVHQNHEASASVGNGLRAVPKGTPQRACPVKTTALDEVSHEALLYFPAAKPP
jgi:hypothetical protein